MPEIQTTPKCVETVEYIHCTVEPHFKELGYI